jgi:hypothetical protein
MISKWLARAKFVASTGAVFGFVMLDSRGGLTGVAVGAAFGVVLAAIVIALGWFDQPARPTRGFDSIRRGHARRETPP